MIKKEKPQDSSKISETESQTNAAIIAQALQEITFARNFKQGKVRNWKINEDLYYGRKINLEYARANVDLGLMQSHVHTILSKIDNPLVFKFTKRKDSQLNRVKRLNGLRQFDQQRDNWDIKDLVGKKQAIIYGRATYSYYASSEGGYTPHLGNVDAYDFLIDPSANGIDIESASYLGDYGVSLLKNEIKDGIASGLYLKAQAETLIAGSSNATTVNMEEMNKQNRTQDQKVWQTNKEISNSDKFKFWRWCTTYQGERYYLLISVTGATAIRIEKLKDVFTSNLWPYWSYAAFPDLTEFWTPSFCDYVREPFMAQAISINQMLDNAEQINKPQRVVNVGAVLNLSELKYRREGIIKVKKDFDVDKAYQVVKTPSIETPIAVYNLLDKIQEKSSGVTAGAQGAADNGSGSKATIYQGNEANAADRFGYLNKSYSFGYHRFAKLYEWGVRDNLTKKIAIDVLGPDGISIEEVGRRDIFWKDDQFGVMVEASNAELALSEQDKKSKAGFLAAQDAIPTGTVQNKKKSYEMQASILGFSEDEIRQLMDTSEFGNAEIMSEADRDIELILDGQDVKPNQAATSAYKQRFVDYMMNNQESMTDQEFKRFTAYVVAIQPIIVRNTLRMANEQLLRQQMEGISKMQPPDPNAAPQDPAAEQVPPAQDAAIATPINSNQQ